jgi:hypothetical protein
MSPNIWQSKTVWTAIITGLCGLAFYFTGQQGLVDTVKLEALCAMIAFLRHGIAKVEL